MGQTEEDVMGDWNNIPRRVSVASFYIDRTEVANVHYREYLYWLNKVFDPLLIRIIKRSSMVHCLILLFGEVN